MVDTSITYTGIALLTVLALPVTMLVVPMLTALRRALGVAPRQAWRTSLLDVIILYGTVPCVMMTLVPSSSAGYLPGNISLVPFEDLPTMSPLGLVGNLLILATLGFFGPIRFRALRSVWRVLALTVAISVSIEVLQHVLPLGRVSSVDDVLLNAGGATVAAVLSWPWWRRRLAPATSPARPLTAGERRRRRGLRGLADGDHLADGTVLTERGAELSASGDLR